MCFAEVKGEPVPGVCSFISAEDKRRASSMTFRLDRKVVLEKARVGRIDEFCCGGLNTGVLFLCFLCVDPKLKLLTSVLFIGLFCGGNERACVSGN